MTKKDGSYNFDGYVDQDEEIDRLERQANTVWNMERRVLQAAGVTPGMHVLDLGCGPGFLSRHIAELVGPAGRVTGIDVNDRLIEAGRQRGLNDGQNQVELRPGDCYSLDLPDASTDFVFARLLFQHLSDPQRALAEARRVLRPGGRICVVDVDDGLVHLFPEPPGYHHFTRRVAEHQRTAGGDREVGRKLGYYLKTVEFTDIAVQITVITSEQIGMQAFFNLAVSFKRELVPGDEREAAGAELERFHARMEQPGSFALMGVYVVTATRP